MDVGFERPAATVGAGIGFEDEEEVKGDGRGGGEGEEGAGGEGEGIVGVGRDEGGDVGAGVFLVAGIGDDRLEAVDGYEGIRRLPCVGEDGQLAGVGGRSGGSPWACVVGGAGVNEEGDRKDGKVAVEIEGELVPVVWDELGRVGRDSVGKPAGSHAEGDMGEGRDGGGGEGHEEGLGIGLDRGLVPLGFEELEGLGDLGHGVAFDVAFEGDEVGVADPLEAAEGVDEGAFVLAGEVADAGGDVDVVDVVAGGDEGAGVVGLFEVHVVEVAHHADAGGVDLLADGGGVGELAEVPGLLAVEGFEEHAGVVFDAVLAEFAEEVDEDLVGVGVLELSLGVVEGGDHDDAGGADLAGEFEEVLGVVDGFAALGFVGDDVRAVGGADGGDPDGGALDGVEDLGGFEGGVEFVADAAELDEVFDLFLVGVAGEAGGLGAEV